MKRSGNGGVTEMSNARDEILGRISEALEDVPDQPDTQEHISRDYRKEGVRPKREVIALFAERVEEYKATVRRISGETLKQQISESCNQQQIGGLVVPPGFPKEWLPVGVTTLTDGKPLTYEELDQTDGVITTCALGVAETGTIILDAGKGQGRRALTLIPDYHLCIIREEQIVELLPEGIAHFTDTVTNKAAPITMISGPSATSDIELSRVEGVHGPRRLEVLIVEG